MSTAPYQPTAFERKVLQVLLKFDQNQDRGLFPSHIASEVWVRKKSAGGRAGQNQAMGAQLWRMCNLGLVLIGEDDRDGIRWFLSDKGMQYAGKP